MKRKALLLLAILMLTLWPALSHALELRGYDPDAGYVYVTLGRCPQDEDGGVRDILWRVLSVGEDEAYLYSEYMKAALHNDMMFRPLAFVYPEDEIAVQTEDQLMLGDQVMIAPVYTQNATGRMVYLPEEMLFVKFGPEGSITQEVLPAGTHFVKVALNEVPLFIRKGACIPVADAAQTVAEIDPATIRMIGWPGASYDRYDDDGVTIPAE